MQPSNPVPPVTNQVPINNQNQPSTPSVPNMGMSFVTSEASVNNTDDAWKL